MSLACEVLSDRTEARQNAGNLVARSDYHESESNRCRYERYSDASFDLKAGQHFFGERTEFSNETFLAKAFGWDAVRAVARNGNYGLTMFFVISGYLITANADCRWSELSAIDARAFNRLCIARPIDQRSHGSFKPVH
jgi:hypothetical protein